MATNDSTQGELIRELFRDVDGDVTIIAPFIKVGALLSLLEVIPTSSKIRCVTRWLPREVAAGVSDPEIIDVLVQRGNFVLSLADSLHAKLYIAGEKCLVGSVNVTLAGLGETNGGNNIEILVETTIHNSGVASTLANILSLERPANQILAKAARRLADRLPSSVISDDVAGHWFPRSRTPERAYRLYSQPPEGFVGRLRRYCFKTWLVATSHQVYLSHNFGQKSARCLPIFHSLQPFSKQERILASPAWMQSTSLICLLTINTQLQICGTRLSTG